MPNKIPLRIRASSIYVPALLTVVYTFSLDDTLLVWLAVFAIVVKMWEDWDMKEEMS